MFKRPKRFYFGCWNFGHWYLFVIWCLVLGIYMLFSLSGCGTFARYREIKPEIIEGKKIEEIELKKPLSVFRVGEKLTYHISWHGVPVGFATTEVKKIVNINGRDCYHFVSTAHSNKFLYLIFFVDDYIESFVDKETLLTIRHVAKRREGRYRTHMILDYDWQNRQLNSQNLVDGTKNVFPLPQTAIDELSAFYYFRTMELSSATPAVFFVNQAGKNWKIEVPITSFGRMNLPPIGEFDAFMVEPTPYLNEKPFDKGKAWIWLSNDENRMPLLLKVNVNVRFLGFVMAVLQKIE